MESSQVRISASPQDKGKGDLVNLSVRVPRGLREHLKVIATLKGETLEAFLFPYLEGVVAAEARELPLLQSLIGVGK
ncbi:MAG: hypothetical protein ACKO24_01335 [Leptolyngbyaceae cyanobacterium]